MVDGQRGYTGVKCKRARRCHPGYDFGGRLMVENVERFMELNPPPVPPIEVSFISITVKCCVRFSVRVQNVSLLVCIS